MRTYKHCLVSINKKNNCRLSNGSWVLKEVKKFDSKKVKNIHTHLQDDQIYADIWCIFNICGESVRLSLCEHI